MGAEAMLTSYFTLISCLIIKLTSNYVSRWDNHAAEAGGDVTWKLFMEWLTKARRTARLARTRELSSMLDSEQTGQ